jgi:hypothetical protein
MAHTDSPDAPVEVSLSTLFWVLVIVVGLLTCGTVGLVLWLSSRWMFPLRIDSTGVTRRDGKRFRWDDATAVGAAYSAATGERLPGTTVTVKFGKDQVVFNPSMLEPRAEIEAAVVPALSQILRRLGQGSRQ